MVVKLHNWPLSAGHECTGCLGAIVQGAALFQAEGGGDEGYKTTERARQENETEDAPKEGMIEEEKEIGCGSQREEGKMFERACSCTFTADEPLPFSRMHTDVTSLVTGSAALHYP